MKTISFGQAFSANKGPKTPVRVHSESPQFGCSKTQQPQFGCSKTQNTSFAAATGKGQRVNYLA